MTVTGTGDLYHTARVHAGRALISLSRHLSRTGARLIGHPCVGADWSPLRSVPTDPEIIAHCTGNARDPRVAALRITETRSAP